MKILFSTLQFFIICYWLFFTDYQLFKYYKKEYLKISCKIFGNYVYIFVDCVQIAKMLFQFFNLITLKIINNESSKSNGIKQYQKKQQSN